MDANSDDGDDFQVGRRHSGCSSSRESSPVAKRKKRSFTPASDDDDLVPVAHNEDTETPTPENAPLIRQAVGFSWNPSTSANLCTYQARVAPQPVVPYFLPGQAPPSPPKPKTSIQKVPRKKKEVQYSDKLIKFKIGGTSPSPSLSGAPTLAGNSVSASSSTPSCSATPATTFPFVYTNGNAALDPCNGATLAPSLGTKKRTRKPSKKQIPVPGNTSSGRSGARTSAMEPTSSPPRYPMLNYTEERSKEMTQLFNTRRVSLPRSTPTNTATTTTAQGPAQGVSRPMRMVTLLIEDLRSGVPDAQLAEVRVPLRIAEDPEDGFWADAVEISNALQAGPSRIDGPAKVYTMRGRFRQFFMRVDQFDKLEVQSAHLGVSKDRTLTIYVEAPMPQGHLPRPPVLSPDVRPVYSSPSERETASPALSYCQPRYSIPTREDQMERLSKSIYARPEKRRVSPMSEGGSYAQAQHASSLHSGTSRHDSYAGSIQRLLTPPIPGRMADTQEEKDEAIANYIRSHIECLPEWAEYIQSQARPQRVSEILKQYNFVDDRVRENIGRRTPPHWDGAPGCYVEEHHIWHVLKLDIEEIKRCEETLSLVAFYGKNGTRYEDSRVVDMIDDTLPPKADAMDRFLHLLRFVDECFTRDAATGNLTIQS